MLDTLDVPTTTFSLKQLRRRKLKLRPETLVVGDHDVMRAAFTQLAIEGPWLETYPAGTEPFWRRRIWRSTLAEARQHVDTAGERLFIKPAEAHKRFTGFVHAPGSGSFAFNGASSQTAVWCASPVEFGAEFRAYVTHGEVVGACRYDDGTADEEAPLAEARAIVDAMRAAGSLIAGFSVDLGRIGDAWALVECNDGFALGLYPGFSPRSYAELLVARWMELSAGAR